MDLYMETFLDHEHDDHEDDAHAMGIIALALACIALLLSCGAIFMTMLPAAKKTSQQVYSTVEVNAEKRGDSVQTAAM